MSHSPSHEGALRMRCGLDELVFPLAAGRVLAPGVLAAINGAQQALLPCCLEPREGQALLVYSVGERLRLAKLLRQPAGIICRCRLCDQHRTAHGSHFLQDFHRNTSGKDQNSILHRNFSKQAVTNHLVYSHMPADIFFVR